jgi:hypothetical protein
MDDAAPSGRSPPPGVKLISGQVAVLIRDALRPAQREMARKARRRPSATAAWSMYAGSGHLTVVAAQPTALIVGTAPLGMTRALALSGAGRSGRATPSVPTQAPAGVRPELEEITERARP